MAHKTQQRLRSHDVYAFRCLIQKVFDQSQYPCIMLLLPMDEVFFYQAHLGTFVCASSLTSWRGRANVL